MPNQQPIDYIKQQSDPHKSRILTLVVSIAIILVLGGSSFAYLYPKYVVYRYDYCSLENNCPTDKCIATTFCADTPGCLSCGCVPEYGCQYKNPLLKEKYVEISREQARRCMKDYILENHERFDILGIKTDDFDVDFDFINPWSNCTFVEGVDQKDSICWAAGPSKSDYTLLTKDGIVTILHIGAQTCKAYSRIFPD